MRRTHEETRSGQPQEPPATSSAEQRLSAVSAAVDALASEPASRDTAAEDRELAYQNRLVQTRLGTASGLFAALRAKHPPTAARALRVALTCSSWAMALELEEAERDVLEIAALLHDVGKIGVPDDVLLKLGPLTADEASVMRRSRDHGRDILTGCGASPKVLEIVYYTPAWYNGQTGEFDRHGRDLPYGSRMLRIAAAFDALLSDQSHRRADSQERAISALCDGAGTQFDPDLVREFARFLQMAPSLLNEAVVSRWLRDLKQAPTRNLRGVAIPHPAGVASSVGQLFHDQLLDSVGEAVMFVDTGLHIRVWNRAAETLTGRPACSVVAQRWSPSLLELRDEHFKLINADRCPVIQAVRSGLSARRRLFLTNQKQQKISVDAEVVPLLGDSGAAQGATVLLRDASLQFDLEEQVQTLNEQVALDGLTRLANRAEFDRVHKELVAAHFLSRRPYSLVICDLDYFKRINDTYGHPAGDEALIAFANLLKQHCRQADLVARYGGEEFVLLYADCNGHTATARAERVRQAWAAQSHPALGGQCLTASFGVTERESGDRPETMLGRADRALLQAKSEGRNRVVRLGVGLRRKAAPPPRGWLSWWGMPHPAEPLLQRRLTMVVPVRLVHEKIRGFVLEYHAEVQTLEPYRVTFLLNSGDVLPLCRRGDRAWTLQIELDLEERPPENEPQGWAGNQNTVVDVVIRPRRIRDRRRRDAQDRAEELLQLLKSYLIAQELVVPAAG